VKLSLRYRRTLAIVLASLALLYLAYVITIVVAIRRGGLTALTRKSEDIRLEARSGHSLWPGRFVLQDVKFRAKDYNIEMGIDARELEFQLAIFPLFWKVIQIDRVWAKDARYRMLHRVKDGHKNRERLAAYPKLGFARPKVYDTPRPPYSVPPFRILVKHIEGNVLEAWFLEYRAVGRFEALGGFELHRDVHVFPGRVKIYDASVFVGPRQILSTLNCDLQAEVGPFPGKESLDKALGATDGKIACSGRIVDLAPTDVYFPDSPVVVEGQGRFDTQLLLRQGQLFASHANATIEVAKLGVADASLRGQAKLSLVVDDKGLSEAEVSWQGEEPAARPLELARARVQLEVVQAKLWQPELLRADVALLGVELRDPKFLRKLEKNADLPLVRLEGAGLDLGYVSTKVSGRGSFEARSQGAVAVFPKEGSSVACAYQTRIVCSLEQEKADCGGAEVSCAPLAFREGPKDKVGIVAALKADTLALERESADSEWSFFLGNPRHVLHLVAANDVWAELGVLVAPLGDVEGRLRVNRRGRTLGGTIDEFRSGLFSGKAGFVLADSFVSRWRINTPLGRFGLSQTPSGTQITPFVPADWDVLGFPN
jgi:hypothetical protein